MADPILTLGDLEPERPTVAIHHNAPDGPWQRFKHRHFDVLLRWFPVRYERRRDLYPLRLPSEFGMGPLTRLRNIEKQLRATNVDDPAELVRASQLLRSMTALILDAPEDVLDDLTDVQHQAILQVFPSAVTGQTPRMAAESPSISDVSSPASAASTAPMTG